MEKLSDNFFQTGFCFGKLMTAITAELPRKDVHRNELKGQL